MVDPAILPGVSADDVAIVKRLCETFVTGDHESAFELHATDVEFHTGALIGAESIYRGHDGVRRFWREYLEAWTDVTFHFERWIDAGERVIVALRQRARGKASGVPVELGPYAQIWTIRAGKVARMELVWSVDEALRRFGGGASG